MPSKRIAIVCALVSVLAIGVAAQDIRDTPGPVEKAAKPITPENPIPRRIFSVPPAYPAEARAVDASALVTMRVTLDASGRIAEIRRMMNPLVRVGPGAPSTPATLQSVGEGMIQSAAAALSQWQYTAPADGPISFNVAFNFQPGTETMSTQDSRTPGSAGAGISALSSPSPPAPPWPAAAGAVRVGGAVKAPTQTRRVNPVYPPEAQTARIQGVVIMEAIIGEDGRVRDTRVLRSIPALDQAALDAVRQWEYTPTLLNGMAVPIVMTVTVQFTLS
jgi:periplasmic protein TonB